MSDYPKSNIAILSRRKGNDGSTYFVGSLGMAMITLTRLPEPNDKGEECWILKTSNPPKRDSGAGERRRQHDAPPDRQANTTRRDGDYGFDARDKGIPF